MNIDRQDNVIFGCAVGAFVLYFAVVIGVIVFICWAIFKVMQHMGVI